MADFISGYNMIQKLGDGARSQVYQVVQATTGKVFALKRVTKDKHEDNRFLEQAINEYEIASKLDHACLRKCYDLKRVRKLLSLAEVQVVMEYVDGISLDKRRPDRIDRIVDLFLKVAEGLDAMHQAGFIHTDIKPNNLLLTVGGGLKIIDFGQSCVIGFRKPRIQGTPDYIAPEQVERRNLTVQTDVFNLGATLYWALTGRTYPTLISGRTKAANPSSRIKLPPAPQEINQEIPTGLSRLVMECCATERLKRPKDMREVIARLETVHHILSKRRDAGHSMSTLAARQPGGDPGTRRGESTPAPGGDTPNTEPKA